jgi:hydrogenase small subunit
MLHEAEVFGSSAAAILCVGTCSSFGGIPAATGNKTGASGALYKGLTKAGKYNGVLQQFAGKIINIAGCPPHPDWIVGTIAYILARNLQALPPVEAYGRPQDYYGMYQCNAGPCEWRYNQGYNANDEGNYSNPKRIAGSGFGVPAGANAVINSSQLYKNKWANDPATGKRTVGCIGVVGCKGRKTKADCSLRRWNSDKPFGPNQGYGTGWCVASGAGCHGCTEPTFPDKVGKFFNFA